MTGRVALVTGAARGIGQAIADQIERDGWRVVRLDLAFADEDGDRVDHVMADVTSYAEIEDVMSRLGVIDAVVNAAGITRDGFFHRMDPGTQWAPVIAVNLTGAFNVCRSAVPGMRERRFGRIINISSMNGLKGQLGQANYAASKAGVIAMTKTIAQEVAKFGITANCVAPGFIDTEMTRAISPEIRAAELAKVPVGRAGQPQEVAQLVSYLLSDAAGFITGETISINGGQLMT